MREFVVSFYKTVLGTRGIEAEACQWSGSVRAPDEASAISAGAIRFCERDGLRDWSAHADRVQVSDLSGRDARLRA